jgi:hypothetical protein
MDNPAPSQRKWRLRRPRKPGDLAALQRSLWWAILQAEEVLAGDEPTVEQRLRAIHALSQAGAVYANLLKSSDLEQRIAALEAALTHRRHGYGA